MTPGWYLHILAAPLGFAVALGWRNRVLMGILLALTLTYTIAAWSFQLSMFSGEAAKLGADKHYSLAGASHFIDVRTLASLGHPLLGAACLILGMIAALGAAALAFRAWRRREPTEMSELSPASAPLVAPPACGVFASQSEVAFGGEHLDTLVDSHPPGATFFVRRAIMALLIGAYLFLAATTAVLLWRTGAGWGAGLAGAVGALALCFAVHELIARAADNGSLRRDLERLREAHRLLADHIEATQIELETLGETLKADADTRTEALTDEVRLLEDLVGRMSESLESRAFDQPRSAAGGGASAGMAAQRGSRPLCSTPYARRWPKTGWICICSPSSPCPSAGRCSTRASRACATRRAVY